jgi:hypothetical protein
MRIRRLWAGDAGIGGFGPRSGYAGGEETSMKARRWPAGSAAVVAVLLVAGCGGGGSGTATTGGSSPAGVAASAGPPPDAAALGQQMKSATAKATSVHILAVVTQEGAKISVNMSMTRAGDLSGTTSANRVAFTMLVTQGHAYIKVTSGLLKSQNLPTASCALICGKYLEVPAGQAKGMLNGMDMSSLLGRVSVSRLTYVRTVTVNGQPAWQMRASDGSMVYVATQGPPYPLRLTKGPSRADFTQWNSVTIPPPPPAGQIVDLSQLTG